MEINILLKTMSNVAGSPGLDEACDGATWAQPQSSLHPGLREGGNRGLRQEPRAGTMEGKGRQLGGGVCETGHCQNGLTRSKSDQRARAASLLWNKL